MNPPQISEVSHHYAGVFLVTKSSKIIGQQRDNKPSIDNPNRIGSFGGTIEDGEDYAAAAWRELIEDVDWRAFLLCLCRRYRPYYTSSLRREA